MPPRRRMRANGVVRRTAILTRRPMFARRQSSHSWTERIAATTAVAGLIVAGAAAFFAYQANKLTTDQTTLLRTQTEYFRTQNEYVRQQLLDERDAVFHPQRAEFMSTLYERSEGCSESERECPFYMPDCPAPRCPVKASIQVREAALIALIELERKRHIAAGGRAPGNHLVARLEDVDLRSVRLPRKDLRYINFHRADLRGSILAGSDLSHSYLVEANLAGADVTGVDFQCSDLSLVNFAQSKQDGTNFTRSTLLAARWIVVPTKLLDKAVYDDDTTFVNIDSRVGIIREVPNLHPETWGLIYERRALERFRAVLRAMKRDGRARWDSILYYQGWVADEFQQRNAYCPFGPSRQLYLGNPRHRHHGSRPEPPMPLAPRDSSETVLNRLLVR